MSYKASSSIGKCLLIGTSCWALIGCRTTKMPVSTLEAKTTHNCSFPANAAAFVTGHTQIPSLSSVFLSGDAHVKDASWDAVSTNLLASSLAYDDRLKISTTMRQFNYPTTEFFVDGAVFGYIAVDATRRCMIISFRGTNEIRDWFTNVRLLQTKVDHGRIHTGFLKAYKSVSERILRHLKNYGAENKTIWVTGHSLGGALAGIMAYDISKVNAAQPDPKKHIVIDRLTTFGQPMFGDAALATYMGRTHGNRYLRVVNNRDMVSRTPTGYVHAGDLLWYTSDQFQLRPVDTSTTSTSLAEVGDISLESPEQAKPKSAKEVPIASNTPKELEPSDEDFKAFMAAGKDTAARPTAPESATRGVAPAGAPAAARSIFGGGLLADHSLKNYIERVTNALQEWSK